MLHLRSGLHFPDGTPVLAHDCVASIRRWGSVDGFGIDVLNPAVSFLARGNGAQAWYGWPDDPALEKLRLSWFEQPSEADQKQVAEAMQRQVRQQASYLPLGQILQPSVYGAAL